jgi:pimeloyl-ACP methyl ester carboxylesterase
VSPAARSSDSRSAAWSRSKWLRTAPRSFTFIVRLAQRKEALDPASGPVVAAQMAAFREWEQSTGTRFGDLRGIHQPTLVVNGIHDEMIPVSNSYRLSENLPNAVLLVYPDSGHAALFQFHESFTRQSGGIPRFGHAIRTVLSRRHRRTRPTTSYQRETTTPTAIPRPRE